MQTVVFNRKCFATEQGIGFGTRTGTYPTPSQRANSVNFDAPLWPELFATIWTTLKLSNLGSCSSQIPIRMDKSIFILCFSKGSSGHIRILQFLWMCINRNPRVSCRGGIILQMDLRAWKETEAKATSFHANVLPEDEVPANSIKAGSLTYQHTDEYETEDGSPSKGNGSGPMPLLEPEDDWVEELPRPIPEALARSRINMEEEKNDE